VGNDVGAAFRQRLVAPKWSACAWVLMISLIGLSFTLLSPTTCPRSLMACAVVANASSVDAPNIRAMTPPEELRLGREIDRYHSKLSDGVRTAALEDRSAAR
jgi:hypothetical protein